MALNNLQSPDDPNSGVSIEEILRPISSDFTIEGLLKLFSSELTIEGLLKLISNEVRHTYRIYGHSPNPEDVKDLTQAIAILLIKDDCRILRSFEHRSLLETWLRAIARHCVLRFLQGQKNMESLEDQSPDDFVYQPAQEAELLIGEIKESLTPHERKLFEFLLQKMKRKEIAERMNIEEDSVHKAIRRLRDKIRKRLESKGGGGDETNVLEESGGIATLGSGETGLRILRPLRPLQVGGTRNHSFSQGSPKAKLFFGGCPVFAPLMSL